MTSKKPTIYLVNVYDKDRNIVEQYQYNSVEDAVDHIEEIETSPYYYRGYGAGLEYLRED